MEMGDVQFLEKTVLVHIMDTHTISFQTVGQFASASGLKFSHDDHNKDNNWILRFNETSISNTNQTIQ